MTIQRDGFGWLAFLGVKSGVVAIDLWLQMNRVARLRGFDCVLDGGQIFADIEVCRREQISEDKKEEEHFHELWRTESMRDEKDAF